MNMPGMNGIDLARKIKAESIFGQTRIIMLTSQIGRPEADSAEQTGTSFYLTKPIRQSQLYKTILSVFKPAEISAASAPDNATTYTFKADILPAEDNGVNQELALSILESLGCCVKVAANGSQALSALERARYDLILMDIQMPEMDGYEATRRIRLQEDLNVEERVPIVALTANALPGDREICLNAGMDDFLSKPFTQNELITVLKRWLPATFSSSRMKNADSIKLIPYAEQNNPGADIAIIDQTAWIQFAP